jgi:hypothetical protein
MTYRICIIYHQMKRKFDNSLEMHTNKLQNIFQLDMWKRNEIISKQPRTDGRTESRVDITVA